MKTKCHNLPIAHLHPLSAYGVRWVLAKDDGTSAMRAISDPIRQGAQGFLKVQYTAVAKVNRAIVFLTHPVSLLGRFLLNISSPVWMCTDILVLISFASFLPKDCGVRECGDFCVISPEATFRQPRGHR